MEKIIFGTFGLLLFSASPSGAEWQWVRSADNDCTHHDRKGPIPGETRPDPKECNERWGGTPAICHAYQPNLPNSPYCTYKDIPNGNCHPDPNGGFPGPTWVCMNQ
jgi:hypothetical protein